MIEGQDDYNPYTAADEPAMPALKGPERGGGGVAGAAEAKRKDSPLPGTFHVAITDPEKKGDGMYSYVTYKINTTSNSSAGQLTQSSVIRRFSDFVWLHTQLYTTFPGLLVPALPDKAFTGRFSGEFISERQRGLQTFFDRVAAHPELCRASDVELFLHGDEANLTAAKEATNNPQKKLSGFMSFMRESAQSVSNSFVPGKDRVKTEEDLSCDQVAAYSSSLETSLAGVHGNVDSLVRRNKDLAKNWFDLGLSCTLLGQFESNQNEEKLGLLFSQLGNTADRLSVLLTTQVEKEQVEFSEELKDHIRMVEAVKQMMKGRAQALSNYQNALVRLEARQAKLAGVQGQQNEKATSAEKTVIEAQAQVDNDKQQLDRVTAGCLAEAARFRESKQKELKAMVVAYVQAQIAHSKKVQGAWEAMLPSLQALE